MVVRAHNFYLSEDSNFYTMACHTYHTCIYKDQEGKKTEEIHKLKEHQISILLVTHENMPCHTKKLVKANQTTDKGKKAT